MGEKMIERLARLAPICQGVKSGRALALARTHHETAELLDEAMGPSDPVHAAYEKRCAELWAEQAEHLASQGN